MLIRDGAHPVLSPGGLLELLEFTMGPAPSAGPEIPGFAETATIDEILAGSDRAAGDILAGLARAELEGQGVLEGGRFSRRTR
jgi:hypothetical protein